MNCKDTSEKETLSSTLDTLEAFYAQVAAYWLINYDMYFN